MHQTENQASTSNGRGALSSEFLENMNYIEKKIQ